MASPHARRPNPYVVLAAALALPGMGHVLIGRAGRGLGFAVFVLAGAGLTTKFASLDAGVIGRHAAGLFVWALSIPDAYRSARLIALRSSHAPIVSSLAAKPRQRGPGAHRRTSERRGAGHRVARPREAAPAAPDARGATRPPPPIPQPPPATHTRTTAHLGRQPLPGQAGARHEQDARQCTPVVDRRSATLRAGRGGAGPGRREQRGDLIPGIVERRGRAMPDQHRTPAPVPFCQAI